MKIILLLSAFCVFTHCSVAVGLQTESRVLGSIVIYDTRDKEELFFNYEFNILDINTYTFQLTSSQDTSKEDIAVFNELSLDIFKNQFKAQLKSYDGGITGDEVDDKATEVFYRIKAKLELIDDEPLTSHMILTKDNVKSFLSNNASKYYGGKLTSLFLDHRVKDFEVEIEYGTIKNATLRLFPDTSSIHIRRYLIFKNQFPFTISSKFDAESLLKSRLYCQNCGGIDDVNRFVRMGDFAFIDNVLENFKEDYSPANTRFFVSPKSPIKELRKEKRSKILEVAAYTDFVGVNRKEPNGLIQIEVSRRLNLLTRHMILRKNRDFSSYFDFGQIASAPKFIDKPSKKMIVFKIVFKQNTDSAQTSYSYKEEFNRLIKKERFIKNVDSLYKQTLGNDILKSSSKWKDSIMVVGYYRLKQRLSAANYFSFLGSFEPKLRFAKIEDNNKNLEYSESDTVAGQIKINPLSLFQYQKISFGGDLNLFKLNYPQLKINYYMNTGVYWYRTGARNLDNNTDDNTLDINALTYNINSFIKFNPDGRWGCTVGAEYLRNDILANGIIFGERSDLMQYKFDGFLNTNQDSKLFFRFRLTNQIGNKGNTFSQIQLGYSMNLFKVSESE